MAGLACQQSSLPWSYCSWGSSPSTGSGSCRFQSFIVTPLGWQAFVCPSPRGLSSWLAKNLIVVLYSISLLHRGRDATCSEHVDTRLHSRTFPSLTVGFSSAAEPSGSRFSAPPPSPRSPLSPQIRHSYSEDATTFCLVSLNTASGLLQHGFLLPPQAKKDTEA